MPANSDFSEIITTTIRNRRRKLFDNVSENNALLTRLRSKGNIEMVSGGRSLVEELDYAENSTYKRYSGYEVLDISPSDVLSAAEYNWKQVAVAVTISGLEKLQNSGREAMINLLKARIKNAERTLANNMSTDIYSDGTADGSKQIGGLQHLVAYTFWRNQEYTGAAAMTTGALALTALTSLWLECCRGNDKPDLIPMDNVAFRYFMESMQDIQRISSSDVATSGFQTLKFITADCVLDGGYGGQIDNAEPTFYMLNTNYLRLRVHKDRNFVPLSPDRHSVNQDATVRLIGWAGNLTMSNAFVQGVYNDT
jgi:hypothetical protein